MGLVDKAREVARRAHEGQVDKAGLPYVLHPERVAARVADDEAAVTVAWLHDVVEDSKITLAELAKDFPSEVIDAVDAVTKREGEAPSDYYVRVAANPLARTVKLADLADNADPERLALLDQETRMRLTAKYVKARDALKTT